VSVEALLAAPVSGASLRIGLVFWVPSPLACEPVRMTFPFVVPRTPVTISPCFKIAEMDAALVASWPVTGLAVAGKAIASTAAMAAPSSNGAAYRAVIFRAAARGRSAGRRPIARWLAGSCGWAVAAGGAWSPAWASDDLLPDIGGAPLLCDGRLAGR